MPVHPCGPFRFNSLLFILEKEYQLSDLHVVHRLDRFTSGVLLLAKTTAKARELTDQIMHNQVQKTYVARVQGEFPIDDTALPVLSIGHCELVEGWFVLQAPVRAVSRRDNIRDCHIEGQMATTRLRRTAFNGSESIVECQPITGRTHQIRVHLQLLGFPIANDPTYGQNAAENYASSIECPEQLLHDREKYPWCEHCHKPLHDSFTRAQLQCQGIWLHALRYQSTKWTFAVEPPHWAVFSSEETET